MWWGWSEAFNIYVGTTLAMIGQRGKSTQVVRLSPTWPLVKILQAIAHQSALQSMGSADRRSASQHRVKLHVTLSGRWCSAWAPPLPEGIELFNELTAYFAGAGKPQGRGEKLAIEFDPTNPAVVAYLDLAVIHQLQAWALEQGAVISSLQPLWSVATESELARKSEVSALVCIEPDGVTMLHCGGQVGYLPIDHSLVEPKLAIEKWKISNDLLPQDVLTLGFSAGAKSQQLGVPKRWSTHWIVL